jgi:hypothetical protein
LNPEADARKEKRTAEICNVYRDRALRDDDITGIQAPERIDPDLPLAPGKPLAREFEHARHGTQTMIAALWLAFTRRIEPPDPGWPICGPRRLSRSSE